MRWAVELVPEVDSTNRVVLDRARAGAPEGLVLVADHQTAGRGRLDRSWEAPPGSSLLASVLLRPAIAPAEAFLSTVAVGLAATEACGLVAGCQPALKWPNDLVLGADERKVAGVLAESLIVGQRVAAVVVGIGLNVRWPDPMPPELAETATSLSHHCGAEPEPSDLLSAWLDRLELRLAQAPAALLADYRAACCTLGRHVRVQLADRTVDGTAVEIDDTGRLVVAGPTTEAFAVGDVRHLRAV